MYGGFSGTYSDGAGQHDDDSDVTTLDATYLVAKEAKTALEETRKARAKALPTDMDNWDSGLKLKGLHFKGFDKPPTLVCYLCGREFGTFSVKIHHDTCKKKYLRRMESLPRRDRKPLPDPPKLKPPTQKDDFALFTAYNEEAQRIYNDFVMHRCPRCERSFAEYSTLKAHMKRCDAPTREEREAQRLEAERLRKEADEAQRAAVAAARAEAAARRKEARVKLKKHASKTRASPESEADRLKRELAEANAAAEAARKREAEASGRRPRPKFLRKGGGKQAANSRLTVESEKQRLARREAAFLKTGIYTDDFELEDEDKYREKPVLRDVLKDRYASPTTRPSTSARSERIETRGGRGRGRGRGRGSGQARRSAGHSDSTSLNDETGSSAHPPIDFEPYENTQPSRQQQASRRSRGHARPATMHREGAGGNIPPSLQAAMDDSARATRDRPGSSKGSRRQAHARSLSDIQEPRTNVDRGATQSRGVPRIDTGRPASRGAYGDFPAPHVRSSADAVTPRRDSPKAEQGRAMLANPTGTRQDQLPSGHSGSLNAAKTESANMVTASQLRQFSIDQVYSFLCDQNLRSVAENFKADDVDGAELIEITTLGELEEYGVGRKAKLKKLLRVLDDIRANNA